LVTHEQYTANTAKRIIKIRDGILESDSSVQSRVDLKNGLVK